MGPDAHDVKEIRLLNRIIAWTPTGIRYEADQRHAEIIIESLGLSNAKGVDTPGVSENKLSDDDSEPLPKHEHTMYRAAAARCNFLGLDRPDIQYAAKEISRGMASPTQGDLIRLKRLGRYLINHPRLVFHYPFRDAPKSIRVYSDTDWAGCIKTRKSTQGGVVLLGGCCIKSWSSTQSLIALSSGEAEYYGVVKASSVALGTQAMLQDMGCRLPIEVMTDASAAKGIASRRGLGKTRHIQVHYLWVQERVGNGDIKLTKVWGGENPADLLTKYLSKDTMLRALQLYGLHRMDGRAASAPAVGSITFMEPPSRW